MKSANLRFYEELNEQLPPDKRKREFLCLFEGNVTVGKLIETVGVPLSRVDLIVCNGESAAPAYTVHDADRISVYPVFESLDIKGTTKVRGEPLRQPRFITAPRLERLAAYLRMLGFDTVQGTGLGVADVAKAAEAGQRILLTRSLGEPNLGARVLVVRSATPRKQAVEVLMRCDLVRLIAPLTRCVRCNRMLVNRTVPLHCESCSGPSGRSYRQRLAVLIRSFKDVGLG